MAFLQIWIVCFIHMHGALAHKFVPMAGGLQRIFPSFFFLPAKCAIAQIPQCQMQQKFQDNTPEPRPREGTGGEKGWQWRGKERGRLSLR